MRTRIHSAFAQLSAATLAVVCIAATPASHSPAPPSPPRVPLVHVPTVRLHTEFVVEVNHLGQVVRVNSAKGCKNYFFNAQTYGNVLQMWIRHPNGTADVGLYRVTYDYDPHTRAVTRHVAIVKRGGTWGNAQGAANEMVDQAQRENEAESGRNLPSLQNIIGTPSPHPR